MIKDILPPALVERAGSPSAWIYPMYRRPGMGNSHAVHILMNINMTIIGQTLIRNRRLGLADDEIEDAAVSDFGDSASEDHDSVEEQTLLSCDEELSQEEESSEDEPVPLVKTDAEWQRRWVRRKRCTVSSGSHLTPTQFVSELRSLRQRSQRVATVLHLFGGEAREEDIEWYVKLIARQRDLHVFVATVDLGVSPD